MSINNPYRIAFWNFAHIIFLAGFITSTMQAQWTQLGTDIDGEDNNDQSGTSVSLSSDGLTVAIGAPDNSNYRGQVRVFKYINGVWIQQGADIDGEAPNNYSGNSVSLSANGTIVAIGAYANNSGINAGHVRVYKIIGGNWIQQGSDIDGEVDGDNSGISVSLSADGLTVAVGAFGNDGGGTSNRGNVRVFKLISGSWIQQGANINGEADGDESGYSVSLSADGSVVAIGAYNNSGGGGTLRGHVRVYKNINGTWTQQGIDIDGEADGDISGWSVALSSDGFSVAIGARYNAGNGGSLRGHVRVYKYINGNWIQQGSDIDGEADGDQSGYSVALSFDGSIVAIGARHNIAGGGPDRGHVRVYKIQDGNWIQKGIDLDGESNGDFSGSSVSLSSDGSIVAIGAQYNAGGGLARGHVRVYSSCSQLNRFLNAILSAVQYGSKKVYVCHQGISTLQVSYPALLMHLAHGDYLGQCGKTNCDGLQLRSSDVDDFIVKEDNAFGLELKLYPNPAENMLNIKFPKSVEGSIQLKVINNLGQEVLDKLIATPQIDNTGISLNIKSIPAGYYILSTSFERYKITKQFIKL